MKKLRSVATAIVVATCIGLAGAQAPTFTVESYSGTGRQFVATAVSSDGSYVFGNVGSSSALSWPTGGIVTGLPGPIATINGASGTSGFVGSGSSQGKLAPVSGNGTSRTSSVLPFGVVTNGLGTTIFANSGSANGASPNGMVTVGRLSYVGTNSGPSRAAFWSGGSVGPFGPDGTSATAATDSTYPFQIAGVGGATSEFEGATVFISDGTRVGTTSLGQAFGFDDIASVRAISDDGNQIVGYSGNSANTYRRPFVFNRQTYAWHQPTEDFDRLSGGFVYAFGASGDATSVIGTYKATDATLHAFVWYPGDGAWDLQTVLSSAGVNFQGYTLTGATAISRDGKVIAGTCVDSTGTISSSYVVRCPQSLRSYSPRPTITSVSPSFLYLSAPGGSTVDVYGSMFTPQSVVKYDGTPLATTYDWWGHLTFSSPTNSYSHVAKVVVSDPALGDSDPFDVPILESNPYFTSITPTTIPAGSINTIVTVYGQYFVENSIAFLNNDSAAIRPTKFIGSQALQFVLTKDDVKNPGQILVGINIPGYGPVGNNLSISVVAATKKFQISLGSATVSSSSGQLNLAFSLINSGNVAVTNIRNVKISLSGGYQGSSQGLPYSPLAVGASGPDTVSFNGTAAGGTKILLSVSGQSDQGSFSLSRVVTAQ